MGVGLHRPEHVQRPALARVHDRELQDDHPQPGAGAELAPAVLQLAEEAGDLEPERRGQGHRADEEGAEEEGAGVDSDRPAR
jgi:hypothetical protein